MSWVSFVFSSLRGRPRTALIALLAAGSAALLTLGATLVGSVYEGTQRSIIESGAGHLQIYRADSPGRPTVIPGPAGAPELHPIADFATAEAAIRSVPGVKDVVPMEVGAAQVFRGNYLDERLQSLRTLVSAPPSAEREQALARMTADLRRVLGEIARDGRQRDALFTSGNAAREDQRALEEAAGDAFWQRFDADRFAALEFLENRVSKQLGEGEAVMMEFIGTDLPRFARAFPRVRLVTGQMPPPGQRGMLMGHGAYEQNFKLPIALRLDEVSRARAAGARLASDERLRALLERNFQELPYFLLEVEPTRAEAVREALARILGKDGGLEPLLKEFLTLDDANFDERYRLFYAEVAPRLRLYRIMPGDSLTLAHLTENTNVRVRVYGTFRFEGLGSDVDRVNAISLVDPVSTQYLVQRQTLAQAKEAKESIAAMDLPPVPTDDMLELRPADVVEAQVATPTGPDHNIVRSKGPPDTYTQADVEAAGVLQAAVVLEPGVDPDAAAGELVSRAGTKGIKLGTADWTVVGGFLSEVVGLSRVALLFASFVIGLIVLVVTGGALVLMANERVSEVGTLRAVGMQRGQVFSLMVLEGLVLGGVGAVVGAAAAVILLKATVGQGFEVSEETLQVFFGGPRLIPRMEAGTILAVVASVIGEVVLASLWPAWSGSSVSPRVAMSRGND